MRFRNISLLGLIAIVTSFAIGVSHVITSIRLARATAELTSLRQRLELIDVDDSKQIAARRLPTSEQFVNRWAVRLPDLSAQGKTPSGDAALGKTHDRYVGPERCRSLLAPETDAAVQVMAGTGMNGPVTAEISRAGVPRATSA